MYHIRYNASYLLCVLVWDALFLLCDMRYDALPAVWSGIKCPIHFVWYGMKCSLLVVWSSIERCVMCNRIDGDCWMHWDYFTCMAAIWQKSVVPLELRKRYKDVIEHTEWLHLCGSWSTLSFSVYCLNGSWENEFLSRKATNWVQKL